MLYKNLKVTTLLILACFIVCMASGCKSRSKTCPAYQEGEYTGGTIDKNKKRRKKKVKQGVFDRKVRKKYR